MPYDPLSFWMKSTQHWVAMLHKQQHVYLQMLCAMGRAVPRTTAADAAKEAESLRRNPSRPAPLHKRKPARKPEPA